MQPIRAKIANHIDDLSGWNRACDGLIMLVIKSLTNNVKILKILDPIIVDTAAFGFFK